MPRNILIPLLLIMSLNIQAAAEHSDLWGIHGEKWQSHSRLPDFSFAGYHMGERPLPNEPAGCSVTDFGAIGDGQTDCTAAFKKAIDAHGGVIYIPEGRYLISDIIWIRKSGVVLKGAGPGKTVLLPNTDLEAVRSNMGATTEGLATSSYSWSGGFIWFKGTRNDQPLTTVSTSALRGDTEFNVTDSSQLSIGQLITIRITDKNDASITTHLYDNDPGEGIADLYELNTASMVTRIEDIRANKLVIERPLRFDLRPEWSPEIETFEPSVSESGVENLSIEFPADAYAGHFKELGRNGIYLQSVSNCWVRNVHFQNADSAIFLKSNFCTLEQITIGSERPDLDGDTGHHGISFTTDAQDNLLQDFAFHTQFIHDITVENMACGNVIKNGSGPNLSFDHHRWVPHDNLFCNIDCGVGSLIWRFGGGNQRGKNTARGATFWGIRSEQPIDLPGENFGPDEVNFVGLHTTLPEITDPEGVWWENIDPNELQPADIHAAQLERRLKQD